MGQGSTQDEITHAYFWRSTRLSDENTDPTDANPSGHSRLKKPTIPVLLCHVWDQTFDELSGGARREDVVSYENGVDCCVLTDTVVYFTADVGGNTYVLPREKSPTFSTNATNFDFESSYTMESTDTVGKLIPENGLPSTSGGNSGVHFAFLAHASEMA